MSGIVSGVIGGAVAVLIGTLVTNAAKKQTSNGELKHGKFILGLGIVCAALSAFAFSAFFYDEDVFEKRSEFMSVLALITFFGLGAAACFAEYFKVRGRFDHDSIGFHTPWTGTKNERWDDLLSAKFNASMYWYTLKFKSGKTIRLSSYLLGHGEVLELLRERGITIK